MSGLATGFGRGVLCCVLLVLTCRSHSVHPSAAPSSAHDAVSCTGATPFQTKAARIVIATFGGSNRNDRSVNEIVESALRRFDEELTQNGEHPLFEIRRAKEVLRSHEAARACAEALSADAVLWGSVFDNPVPASAALVEQQVTVGPVSTGANSTINIGNIDLGGKPFSLVPSITLRREKQWLMSSSRMDVVSLADVDFQAVASDRSLFFVPFLAAAAAFERGDTARALSMFELATNGSLKASGVPRVYAATYLGALRLSMGRTKEAAEGLAATTDTELALAPPSLGWQNRILFALANEQRGKIEAAFSGYSAAETLNAKADPASAALATLAKAWTQLRRGDGRGALDSLNKVDAKFPPCGPLTEDRCLTAELVRGRIVTMKGLALGMVGQTDGLAQCMNVMRSVLGTLSSSVAKDVDVEAPFQQAFEPLSPDQPPKLFQIVVGQPGGCATVHFSEEMEAMLPADASSEDDYLHVQRQIEEGRGTLGALLKRLPPSFARSYEMNMACTFSLMALNAGLSDDAIKLAEIAASKSDDSDPPLTRAELLLMKALPVLRLPANAPKRSQRVRTAEDSIRGILPVLRDALGANAPTVQRWEKTLALHKLPPRTVDPDASGSCADNE